MITDHPFKPCFYLQNGTPVGSIEGIGLCLFGNYKRCHAKSCGKTAAEHGIPKCDGNHAGPRCADPECWNQ